MEEFIDFIASGKEWIFSGIGASVLVGIISFVWKNKKNEQSKDSDKMPVIIINNNTGDKINSINSDGGNVYSGSHNGSRRKRGQTQASEKKYANSIEISKIRFYTTGIKGKVYNTSTFHKKLNHNLGIELFIRNNTKQKQKISVRCCIKGENGCVVYDKAHIREVASRAVLNTDIYAPDKIFAKLRPGKYSAQYWANGKGIGCFQFSVISQ